MTDHIGGQVRSSPKRPMRLLFVIDSLVSGGAQRQMVNLALGLVRRHHTVEFFTYRPGTHHLAPLLKQQGIQVHQYRKRHRFSVSVIFALRNLIRRGNYDVVLSFLTTPNLYNLAARCSLLRYPRLIVSERTCDLPGRIPPSRRIARPLYRIADHVVVNSDHHREYLARRYPFLRRKLSTIYNGLDLTHFAPRRTPALDGGRDLKLLVIADTSRSKNGLCLVDAVGILSRSYGVFPTVSWVGDQEAEGDRLVYRREMEQAICRNGLRAQWRWLGQRDDVVDLLHEHDLLVHPSYVEGMPNVVCEALACGCPVIVSDTLDHPRLVEDGVSGFVFDWREPADLAAKIRQFQTLPETSKAEMGRRARQYAVHSLSLQRYVDDFEGMMSSLLGE